MAKLQAPLIIGAKYELLRELGRGENATVYEAMQLILGKRVALKLITRPSPEAHHAVLREARAAARIEHPNVIDILDTGVDAKGRAYVAMEYLSGETLAEIIETRGPLPVPYACELMVQVLEGMAAAHKVHVIHCDLKPANVFVTHPAPHRPEVKVLDFGVAETSDQTHTGAGTPAYMAPEQALGLGLDGRADVFSASVMLYELVSGELPFRATSLEAMFAATIAGRFVPLAEVAPTVPRGLACAIERGLAGNREHRTASAEEMLERIRPFAAWASTASSGGRSLAPIPLLQRRRQRQRPQLPMISPGPLADALHWATQHA